VQSSISDQIKYAFRMYCLEDPVRIEERAVEHYTVAHDLGELIALL